MKRLFSLVLVISLIFGIYPCVQAEEAESGVSTSENLLDDCADFSVALSHSEGILPDVITEENRFAFAGDYTVFMRSTLEEESLIYEIPKGGYLTFYTLFRQNAEVAHFKFEYSEDNETWQTADAITEQETVDSSHWIPVSYKLKFLPENAKYLRVSFAKSADEVPWSPCIASVDCKFTGDMNYGFSDCVGTPCERATTILKNLGLINGYSANTFSPNNSITRAEFSQMLAVALNVKTTYSEGQPQYFKDVESGHWASGAIYALYGMGIINGDELGNFNPEDNVTVSEAAKMLVTALGYGIFAERRGGYPSGYLLQARNLGILDDVENTDVLDRGNSAIMLYNATNADVINQTKYGDDTEYVYGDATLLEQYHNIKKVEGVLTDCDNMSVYSMPKADEGFCVIDDIRYKNSDFKADNLLGQHIIGYVKDSYKDGNSTLLYAYSDAETVVVARPDFLDIKDNRIEYLKGDTICKAKLSDDTKIIYNNRYLTRIGVMDEFPFESGYITLVKNNSSGVVDTVLIKDYKTYFMTAASTLKNPLSDRRLGAVKLELDKYKTVRIFEYGEEIEYSEDYIIPSNTLVQVAKSNDLSYAEVYICGKTAKGAVRYSNKSDGLYFIDDTEYKASEYFKKYEEDIEAENNEVMVYLDINDCISIAEDDAQGFLYGYLCKTAQTDVFSKKAVLNVVTESGRAREYTVDAKTRFNGGKDRVGSVLNLTPQLIRLKADDNGYIKSIDTAVDYIGDSNIESFSRNYTSNASKYIGEKIKVFGSIYQLDNKTKVFFVPEDVTDTESYMVLGESSLYTDFSYKVDVFDLSKQYVAGAVVIYNDGSDVRKVASYDPVAIVQNVQTRLDDNDDEVLNVKAYVGGTITDIKFDADGAKDFTNGWIDSGVRDTADGNHAFEKGEIFQYYIDSSGYCHSFRMLLSRKQIEDSLFYEKNLGDYGSLSESRYYSELYTGFGTVSDLFPNKFLLSVNGIKRTIPIGSNICIFDKSTGDVTKGDATDIATGDIVFVRIYYTGVSEILIIK